MMADLLHKCIVHSANTPIILVGCMLVLSVGMHFVLYDFVFASAGKG